MIAVFTFIDAREIKVTVPVMSPVASPTSFTHITEPPSFFKDPSLQAREPAIIHRVKVYANNK